MWQGGACTVEATCTLVYAKPKSRWSTYRSNTSRSVHSLERDEERGARVGGASDVTSQPELYKENFNIESKILSSHAAAAGGYL